MPIGGTARDFVSLAAKQAGILGVGQTLLGEDTNDCFKYLQAMLAQWQVKRWLVPNLQSVSALGNSAVSNTVGPGGHFDITPRPTKISMAWVVQLPTDGGNPVSLPLTPIFSREDYSLISVKDLNSLPNYFFYENSFASGRSNIFIWPIPNSSYRIYLLGNGDLGFPATLDSPFIMPDEYYEPILQNLAIRICAGYGVQPNPATVVLAKVGLNTIRKNNTQIPSLKMPAGVNSGRSFNIYNADGY